MEKLFIPYELAVIAKEKGFNECGLSYYNNDGKLPEYPHNGILLPVDIDNEHGYFNSNFKDSKYCTSPLYQQIVDWFREKHNITIESFSMLKGVRKASYETVFRVQKWHNPNGYRDSNYKTLNKAIEEAFKLIKS